MENSNVLDLPRYGTLYIVTYDRGTYATTGQTKPYHWAYFFEMSKTVEGQPGFVYQLRGMPGAFYFPGREFAERAEVDQGRTDELEIGRAQWETGSAQMEDILRALPIDTVESSGWNCQNWTLAGFAKLQEAGLVYDHLTPEAVKDWLKEKS